MKWALIGASDIAATRVIPALREIGDEPVGVISGSAARGDSFAQEHSLAFSSTDIADIRAWDVEAAYISSTNQLHAEQAIRCAEAGLHILCEKPLAMSVSDIRRMIAACDEAGVILATNHHLRNKGTIRAIRDQIASGAIGKVLAVRMHHAVSLPERLRGWRLTDAAAGAGVVLDITVHDADTLRYITGAEIESVSAVTATQGLGADGVEDSAIVTMVLDSGILAVAHESFVVPHAGMGLEVHGTEGSIFAEGALNQESEGDVLIRRNDQMENVSIQDRSDAYVVGLRAFDAAASGEGTPSATGADGLKSVAVALAALRSASEGRTVTVQEILEGEGS